MLRALLGISGAIFTLVAILHLYRILEGTLILFGTTVMPMWASYVGLVVALAMAIWNFAALGCCVTCHKEFNSKDKISKGKKI